MRAYPTIPILVSLVLGWSPAPLAALEHQWSASFGDASDQVATCVAMDAAGGVALVGHFNGGVDFGGGALACPSAATATYLARFDAGGGHLWSRVLGDSIEPGTNKLCIDDAGNTLVALEMRGSVDLGSGPVTATGFRDGVIAKYDSYGDVLWCRTFGGPSAAVTVKAAGLDGAGNLIVAGTYTGDLDFTGATLDYQAFTTNVFLVKFDTDGNHLWSRRLTGGLVEITAVTGDPSGCTVVAGYHGSAFDFGGGPLDADLYDVFVARYGPTGTHLWSHSFGDPGTYQQAFDAATDDAGNVIVTGHFKSAVDFGGGYLTSAGGWDVFVAGFDSAGAHRWSRSFGDANTQRAYSVAVDGSGAVTVAGHFMGTVDFGGGPRTADPLDFFAAGLDGSGNYLWDRRLDLYNLGMKNDKPYAISAAANAAGNLALAGSFTESVDCGGGALASAGSFDTFVARYGSPPTGIVTAPASSRELRVFPNPFNPRTTIAFELNEPAIVRLTVHDVRGGRARTLLDRHLDPGAQTVQWDGRDDDGRPVVSGVYFARLQTGGAVTVRRLVLLK